MKHHLYLAALKALCATLMLAILETGAYAIHLTHVYGIVTVSFGEVEKVEPIKVPATINSNPKGK